MPRNKPAVATSDESAVLDFGTDAPETSATPQSLEEAMRMIEEMKAKLAAKPKRGGNVGNLKPRERKVVTLADVAAKQSKRPLKWAVQQTAGYVEELVRAGASLEDALETVWQESVKQHVVAVIQTRGETPLLHAANHYFQVNFPMSLTKADRKKLGIGEFTGKASNGADEPDTDSDELGAFEESFN